jgi:hypothetical protein
MGANAGRIQQVIIHGNVSQVDAGIRTRGELRDIWRQSSKGQEGADGATRPALYCAAAIVSVIKLRF